MNNQNHSQGTKRCSQCILPSNYPEIIFDQSETCNYCKEYKHQNPLGDDAFQTVLESVKEKTICGKKGGYDCLIPLSGGRDSTYVLHQMKEKHKLNVLAFNYDNGFVSSVAIDNVEKICSKLGVELIKVKSKRDIQRKYLRHVIKLNLHKSPAHVISGLCSGCRNGIWGGAHEIAKKYEIPLVVFGESSMESGTAKKIIGRQLKRTANEKIKYAFKMPVNFLLRKYTCTLLEKEFPLNDFTDVKKINYFDYFEWDEGDMINLLYNNLSWQNENNMSTWRFDCKIHAVVNYMHRRLYGFTEKDELYSKMIREHQITREQGLDKIKNDPVYDEKELLVVQDVFEKLKLPKRERLAVLNLETL